MARRMTRTPGMANAARRMRRQTSRSRRIVNFDSRLADGAFQLRASWQQLNGTDILRALADLRCSCFVAHGQAWRTGRGSRGKVPRAHRAPPGSLFLAGCTRVALDSAMRSASGAFRHPSSVPAIDARLSGRAGAHLCRAGLLRAPRTNSKGQEGKGDRQDPHGELRSELNFLQQCAARNRRLAIHSRHLQGPLRPQQASRFFGMQPKLDGRYRWAGVRGLHGKACAR